MSREAIANEIGFEPCRDESCPETEIHPKHKLDALPGCPVCQAQLIKMPRKRARCSACNWRGKITKPKKKVTQLHA